MSVEILCNVDFISIYSILLRDEPNQSSTSSIAARNNLDTRDLSQVGISSPPPDVKNITIKKKQDNEDSWDWL